MYLPENYAKENIQNQADIVSLRILITLIMDNMKAAFKGFQNQISRNLHHPQRAHW
jgi:hypothetical protein